MKFKKGDKVRVVGKHWQILDLLGKVGVVRKVSHGNVFPYYVKFPFETRTFRAQELEKVESESGR